MAGLTLPACAACQRDGQALGLVLAPLLFLHLLGLKPGVGVISAVALNAWLAGCGLNARPFGAGGTTLLVALIEFSGGNASTGIQAEGMALLLAVQAVIFAVGNPVSVFSHLCATLVIARSEGEPDLLPSQPREDFSVLLEAPFL